MKDGATKLADWQHHSFRNRLPDFLLRGWGVPELSWLRTHPPTEERLRERNDALVEQPAGFGLAPQAPRDSRYRRILMTSECYE